MDKEYIVEQVVRSRRIRTRKHSWKKDFDGKIDIFAYSKGFCNGPRCVICGEGFCHHCNPNVYEEETCIEHFVCGECGRVVPEDAPYCNCGAKMDGKDETE